MMGMYGLILVYMSSINDRDQTKNMDAKVETILLTTYGVVSSLFPNTEKSIPVFLQKKHNRRVVRRPFEEPFR